MFNKKSLYEDKFKKNELPEDVSEELPKTTTLSSGVNTILKGSKLTGDINVTYDLEVSGDVDGNITSLKNSNIVIKGICKGNIATKEGSINIEGELQGGNISAGKNVTISGKFNGGEVKAAGKIFIDGEFDGKLEGNDIEIGANSSGKGEIFYKEFISISKGAKVDVQISQAKQSLQEVKPPLKTTVTEAEPAKLSFENK
jgi:cytoskeletal protein CcmA (bactofilin family)